MRTRRILVAVGLVAVAYASGQLVARPAIGQGLVALTGDDVPIYYQVDVFFHQALALVELEGEDGVFYDQFLERLGFKPDSAEERALVTVLYAFADLEKARRQDAAVEAELVRLADDEPAYWKRLNEWERQKAGAVGDLYRRLADGLKEAGSSIEVIQSFIARNVSPQTSLTSDRPLDDEFFSISREFQKHAFEGH